MPTRLSHRVNKRANTAAEQALVDCYRQLRRRGRQVLLELARFMAARATGADMQT